MICLSPIACSPTKQFSKACGAEVQWIVSLHISHGRKKEMNFPWWVMRMGHPVIAFLVHKNQESSKTCLHGGLLPISISLQFTECAIEKGTHCSNSSVILFTGLHLLPHPYVNPITPHKPRVPPDGTVFVLHLFLLLPFRPFFRGRGASNGFFTIAAFRISFSFF